MKKYFLILCLIIFAFLAPSNVYSAESETAVNVTDLGYERTPFNKLARGVLNLATFVVEIPASIIRVSKEKDNAFLGGTVGAVQGLVTALLRGLTGVFDTTTFIIPPYDKTLLEPEYAVQSLEEALR